MQGSKIPLVIPLALAVAACGGPDMGSGAGEAPSALTQSTTTGGVQVTLTISGPLIQGVPNTYTWTATNLPTT